MVSQMETRFGDYRIRPRERELIGPEGLIELSARSFDLLDALLAQPNQLLDKAALFDHFALDKLAEAGEDVATRDRHAAYVRDLFADLFEVDHLAGFIKTERQRLKV